MIDLVRKLVAETPKERRLAYLTFLMIVWCFGIYLLVFGNVPSMLKTIYIASTSIALFVYSFVLISLTSADDKEDQQSNSVVLQVLLVLVFVGLIIFNLLFAYSIYHHGKSPLAIVLLCFSAILWFFHRWSHRYLGVVTLFATGYLIVELEG